MDETTYTIEFREFEFELTPLELAGRGRDVAAKLASADKAEQERLRLVAEATEKRKEKKGLEAAALEASRVLHSGKERRRQKCEWRPAATAARMELHRLDLPEDHSGRIVDHRPMTKAELKGQMSGEVAASTTQPSSDSAAANGHARNASVTKFERACPGTISEPERDDPTKDVLCDQQCLPRRWACERHVTLPQGEKARLVARQLERRHQVEQTFAEAAGPELQ